MRVLLAEDDAMNVEFFLAALQGDGHTVTVARDGLAARARALAETFDIFVLDIQMPKLDGYALCRELRERGIRQPIVALSAAAMPADAERGREAGFDLYLTKPISVVELRAAVRRFGKRTSTP